MLLPSRVMRLLLATSALSAAPALAMASPFLASDVLQTFNAVTSGALTASESGGPAVAGGQMNLPQVNFNNVALPATFAGFGDANGYANVHVQNANGQKIFAAGVFTGGTPSGAAVATQNYSFPHPLSDFLSPFTTLSNNLRTLAADTISSLPQNNGTLTPTTITTMNGIKVGVIDVTGAVLDQTTSLKVDLNGADLLVVNVNAPGAFVFNGPFNDVANAKTHTLFNFYNATSITVPNWEGSILALGATINASSPLEGSIIANAINNSGELHYFPLTTAANAFINAEASPAVAKIPEPASIGLFGLGLIGLGLARRKRAA